MYRLVLLFAVLSGIAFLPQHGNTIQAQDEVPIEVGLIPPTPGESPDETLNKCLEWYKEKLPLPRKYVYWDCNEVVGYHGTLAFTAVEGMKGMKPGVRYVVEGDVGETTDSTMSMGQYDLNSIYSRQPQDYSITIEGYERCVEPALDVYSERNAVDVGGTTKVILHLNCDLQPMHDKVIKLEVVSGPGELKLPPIAPLELEKLGIDQNGSDKSVVTDDANGKAEATLTATGEGVIEIRATYEYCSNDANKGELVRTIKVRAGKWVSIDCTYTSDPERFGDDPLRWGGTVHADVCLKTFEEKVEGYTVTRVGGEGQGTQECWVEPGPSEWIDNKNCPEFDVSVTSGMVWPDVYSFMLDLPDSAALTFDIVYNEGDSRLSCREWDPIVAMETPISLGFANDTEFTYSDKTVNGTDYEVVVKWMN